MIQRNQILILLIVVFISYCNISVGQQTDEKWLGTLDVKVATLRLQLNLNVDDSGKYTGAMVSLDQGGVAVPMDTVVRNDKKLEFEIKGIRAKFKGTLNDDQTVAKGVFSQGADFEMEFKRVGENPFGTAHLFMERDFGSRGTQIRFSISRV